MAKLLLQPSLQLVRPSAFMRSFVYPGTGRQCPSSYMFVTTTTMVRLPSIINSSSPGKNNYNKLLQDEAAQDESESFSEDDTGDLPSTIECYFFPIKSLSELQAERAMAMKFHKFSEYKKGNSLSTINSLFTINSLSTINSSPWLMLPTVPEMASLPGQTNNHNKLQEEEDAAAMPPTVVHRQFYSLSEKRVITINNKSSSPELDPDAHCVGSCHGWLGLINRQPDFDFFLLNPITGRCIKLPSIRMLNRFGSQKDSYYDMYKKDAFWKIVRFVMSSPNPDAQDCRVIIHFRTDSGSGDTKLAYCCPGLGDGDNDSSFWTFLNTPIMHDSFDQYMHIDYSPKDQRLFAMADYFHTSSREEEVQMESWDLTDPCNPKRYPVVPEKKGRMARMYRYWKSYDECKKHDISVIDKSYLIADPTSSGQLYLIDRFAFSVAAEEGMYDSDERPYKTLSFDAYKFDTAYSSRSLEYMETLDDRAFFIGLNGGFCLSANDFPELKPNSIYFTDDICQFYSKKRFGGGDIGIYNYKEKRIEGCYYPVEDDDAKLYKIIESPAPVWFTPTPSPSHI